MRKINAVHVAIAGLLAFSLFGATMIGTAHARMGDGCDYGGKGAEHHGMFSGRMAKRLGLSDAQREQIDAIMRARADGVRAKVKELRTVREELHGYATSTTFDPAKVKAAADRQAALMSDLTVSRVTAFNQAYKLLTDEQKHKLADWKDRHEAGHGDDHDADAAPGK